VGIEAMSCQYNWSSGVQGTLLSAFFWGYALFQIPGGFLTNKFGGKLIFGIGVLMTSILTCLVTYLFRTRVFFSPPNASQFEKKKKTKLLSKNRAFLRRN
jgi:MFS family permease